MDDDEANAEFDRIVAGDDRSRYSRLLSGDLRIEDLDDEELYRGQCRDKNGKFSGSKPEMIPRSFVVEWQRRVRTGAINRLDGNLLAFTEALVSIATNPEAAASDRLNAIKYGMDRVLGKATERVDLQVEMKPWEKLTLPDGIYRQITTPEIES